MRKTNSERWIDAMIAGVETLGLDERDLEVLRHCFRKQAPKHPLTKEVLALESDVEGMKARAVNMPIIGPPVKAVEKPKRIKRTRRRILPSVNMNNYKYPLVRVSNINGELLRYEDAEGQKVPEAFWPKVSLH